MIAIVFYLINSTATYWRANGYIRVEVDITDASVLREIEEKIKSLNEKIKNIDSADRTASSRKQAMQAKITELQEQKKEVKEILKFELHEASEKLITPYFKNPMLESLWRNLLPLCGSIATAYLTYLSLTAMYERLDAEGSDAEIWLARTVDVIAPLYGCSRLFRYMTSFFGTRYQAEGYSEEEKNLFFKKVDGSLDGADELLRGGTIPPVNNGKRPQVKVN
jgi:hypothetical protein